MTFKRVILSKTYRNHFDFEKKKLHIHFSLPVLEHHFRFKKKRKEEEDSPWT